MDHNVVLEKFQRGERLTRRERRDLEMFNAMRHVTEMEHICLALQGQQPPSEILSVEDFEAEGLDA